MSTLGPTQCKEVSEKLLDKCMIAYINECVDEPISKPGLEFKHTDSLSLIFSLPLSTALPFEAEHETNKGFDQFFAFHLEFLCSDIIDFIWKTQYKYT